MFRQLPAAVNAALRGCRGNRGIDLLPSPPT
jgi:hypothetical protein